MKKEAEKKSGGVKDTEVGGKGPKVFAKLTFDKGFKIVLGTEGRSERILISLLNRLLDLKIVELQFLQTEKMGLTEEEEASVFDVYCKDETGRRYLIEMQMCNQPHFNKRSGYYLSLAVLDQAREARRRCKDAGKKWDYDYEPVYVVSFLNSRNNISEDIDDPRANPYISHYITRSIATGKPLKDDKNRVFIDLYRFQKTFEECENDIERWLFSIKYMHQLKDFPKGVDGTELEELYYEAELAAWSPDLRTKYDRLMATEHDREISLQYEKQLAREEGLAEGRAEGRAEGLAEGIAEGIAKGIAEANRVTARNLLKLGVETEKIMQATGLTTAEIESL